MKKEIKNKLPGWLLCCLRFLIHPLHYFKKIYENYLIKVQPLRYKKLVARMEHKKHITVAFFATHCSVWKYDLLYKLMLEHPRFNPVVIVCPVVNYGFENMLTEMDKCHTQFKEKGYNVLRAYDIGSKKYLNVKKEINPDIVFYTNPYKGLIDYRYFITNFLDRLTCYVPYSASICSIPTQFNKLLHLLVWRFFVENDLSYNIAHKEMPNHAINTVAVGYPSLDVMLMESYSISKVWQHNQKIKIIWAPHHSFDLECCINFSNFFQTSEKMLEMADKYKDTIQIAFKPHPLLYVKLLKVWGIEKTNAYYKRWNDGINTQYENGQYIDLFMGSDAMIFDSVSFIHEYLFTKKKSLFICRPDVKKQLNEFGLEALKCHQQCYSTDNIEKFIEGVIKGNSDELYQAKERYFNKHILPANSNLASQNIMNELLSLLK